MADRRARGHSGTSTPAADARAALARLRAWFTSAYVGVLDEDFKFAASDFAEVEEYLKTARKIAASLTYSRRRRFQRWLESLEAHLREMYARRAERNERWHELSLQQRQMLHLASGKVNWDGANPAAALDEELRTARLLGWVEDPVDAAAADRQFEHFYSLLELHEPCHDLFALLDALEREVSVVDGAVEVADSHLARQALAHGRLLRPRSARREAQPRARRTAARRSLGERAGQDPGSAGGDDDPPGDQAPLAAVIPFPRRPARPATLYSYAVLSASERGAEVFA